MRGSTFLMFAVVAVGACGAERHGPVAARPPLPRRVVDPAPDASATWAFRYTGESRARVALDGDARLEVGPNGERWLLRRGWRVRSETFFREPIVGAARAADEIAFVTAKGAIYAVPLGAPLAEAGPARRPPGDATHVAAGARAVIAESNGALLRTTDAGRTWARVAIGGEPRAFGSLAMTRSGAGALVMLPQRSLVTVDDGATWQHVTPPSLGIAKVGSDGERVLAESVTGDTSAELSPAPLRWVPRGHATQTREEAPRFEYATAASRGEGVFAGTRWLELVGTERGTELWLEDITERLPPRRLRAFPECKDAPRLGASSDGGDIVVTCNTSAKGKSLSVFRTADGGEQWTEDPSLALSGSSLYVHVAAGGTTIVRGACTANAAESCPSHAVVGGARGYANIQLEASGAPADAPLDAFALTPEGFVAFSTQGEATVALVSQDGGRHARVTQRFGEALWLDLVTMDAQRGLARVGDELLVTTDGGASWKKRSLGLPTTSTAMLAFSGFRGLAVHEGGVLESLDGGASWAAISAPQVPAPGPVCGELGCIVDTTVRRIGWGGPPAEARAAPEPEHAPAPPRLRCKASGKMDESAGWLEPPIVDLDDGRRWAALVRSTGKDHPAARVWSERERDGKLARELSSPISGPPPPLVFEASATEHGVVTLSYRGHCALNCHGYVYDGDAPVTVTWIPTGGSGAAQRASIVPGPEARNRELRARVLRDGTVLLVAGDEGHIVTARGVTRTFFGQAWDVVAIERKVYAASESLLLRDVASPPGTAVAWTLGGHEGPDDRFGLVPFAGAPHAWSQIGASLFLVKLDPHESEPSTVRRVDAATLASGPTFTACRKTSEPRARVPYAFPRPIAIALEGDSGEERPLEITSAVLRVGADGTACVSAFVATARTFDWTVAIDPRDMTRATAFHSDAKRGVSSVGGASCR